MPVFAADGCYCKFRCVTAKLHRVHSAGSEIDDGVCFFSTCDDKDNANATASAVIFRLSTTVYTARTMGDVANALVLRLLRWVHPV